MPTINIADKETLDRVEELCKLTYDAVAETGRIFGFIERGNVLNPDTRIEYIGTNKDYTPFSLDASSGTMDLGSWRGFEWLEENRPAMVRSDGTLDYWLDDTDYTKKIDGSNSDAANTDYDGHAMAWIPKIYKYEENIGIDRIVKFSMHHLEGYDPVGFIDPDGAELDGVWIPLFYGWKDSAGKMRSIANGDIATHSLNTSQEWTAISANGDRAKFFGGPIVETLIDLMILFSKKTDLQAAFGNGNRSGYISSDTTTYGKTANTCTNMGQFYGTSDGKSINRVFHSMVLITQNQYQRDPYLLCVRGRFKVSKDYKYDLTGESYFDTGIDMLPAPESGRWSYPNHWESIKGFGALPHPTPEKGSTSLGRCDGVYRSSSQASILAVSPRFCSCDHGSIGGPCALTLGASAGDANWNIGASVLLLPPPPVQEEIPEV